MKPAAVGIARQLGGAALIRRTAGIIKAIVFHNPSPADPNTGP